MVLSNYILSKCNALVVGADVDSYETSFAVHYSGYVTGGTMNIASVTVTEQIMRQKIA